MSKDGFRSLVLLCYRTLGPLILALSGIGAAIELGWIDNPVRHEPFYTVYVMTVFAAVFALPFITIGVLAGSVLFAREWPFVLPLWLLAVPVLLFVGPLVVDLLTNEAHAVRGETLLEVLLVAAAGAATFVGYRRAG